MNRLLFLLCCLLALNVGCTDHRPVIKQDRFSVFIHKNKMHVELNGASQPVTLQMLNDHGVLVAELEAAFLDISRIIGSDDSPNRSVQYTGPVDSFPAAEFTISESPNTDPRFTHFGVNIFDGQIYIEFWDANGKIPRSTAEQLAIDWEEFASAVSRLESSLAAENLDAALSDPVPDGTGSTFEVTYQLHRRQP